MMLVEKSQAELVDAFIASAHPDSIVGQLFPQPERPVKPIRVYQCKQDCCAVQVPGRRFWYVRTPKGRETYSNFREAVYYATYEAKSLPLEVTA